MEANLLPVSKDLSILDNQTTCSLLCLASLTECHVSEVHPCCSVCQCFSELNNIPQHGYSTVWMWPMLFSQASVGGHLVAATF